MGKRERQSNLEFLRILAMLMIITLHFFEGNRIPQSHSQNQYIYYIYESLSICGVDLFVLLTGYFSLRQDRIKFRKIVDLLIDVAFWCFIGFMLNVAAGDRPFSLKELIRNMFPFVFGGRWFIKAYILLMLLVPFINRVVMTIDKKSFQILLTIQLLLFSIWPSFLPNPPFDDYGYSFIHFITLYLIAAYMRLYVDHYPAKWLCICGYLVSFAIVLLTKVMNWGYEWAYNYPFVITEALFLFMYFLQVSLNSGLINRLASCAFGVYLIHTNSYFSSIGYNLLFRGSSAANGPAWMLVIIVPACSLFFYFFGFVLESAKKILFHYTVEPICDRLPFLNEGIRIQGSNLI